MDYINLYKLNKEIKKSKDTRNTIINNFIKDSNHAIHNLNIDYLIKVPFPLIITNRDLFEGNSIKVKIYKEDYLYHDYLFSNQGVVNNQEDLITNSIITYINGLFRVKSEERILDNEFYQDLIVSLYNRIGKVIINGYGVNLDKELLKKLIIINSKELDKYRLKNNKKKVLEIYRGKK